MSKSQQIAYNNGWNKGRYPDDPRFQVAAPTGDVLAAHFDSGYRAGVIERVNPGPHLVHYETAYGSTQRLSFGILCI